MQRKGVQNKMAKETGRIGGLVTRRKRQMAAEEQKEAGER